MPDLSEYIEGTDLTFPYVTRHEAGKYECIADNGYGLPVRFF